jgi:hypothetical protein
MLEHQISNLLANGSDESTTFVQLNRLLHGRCAGNWKVRYDTQLEFFNTARLGSNTSHKLAGNNLNETYIITVSWSSSTPFVCSQQENNSKRTLKESMTKTASSKTEINHNFIRKKTSKHTTVWKQTVSKLLHMLYCNQPCTKWNQGVQWFASQFWLFNILLNILSNIASSDKFDHHTIKMLSVLTQQHG